MKKLHDLKVRTKLFIAYGLFVLPVAFLFSVIIGKSLTDIDFARKEQRGVQYITAVRAVQDALLRDAAPLPNAGLAERISVAEQAMGADMSTAEQAKATAAALSAKDPAARDQARGALRDLIGKIADGSNLTLDPDLDSFYVMDVAVGKVPEALDRVYGLATLTARYAGKVELTPDEQAAYLIQEGSLTPVLDGVGASAETAFKANAATRSALGAPLREVRDAMPIAGAALHAAALQDRSAGAAASGVPVGRALTALSSLGQRGDEELSRLLEVRISGFFRSLYIDFAVAIALFVVAVGFILIAIQSGVVSPLGTLTGLMRRLTDDDLEVPVPATDRKDEIGDMAGVLAAFKAKALENARLTAEKERDQAIKNRRQSQVDQHIKSFGETISDVMASLVSTAKGMRDAASEMSGAAAETRESSTHAVGQAQVSSRDLSTVAVAAEEMAASVDEISRQVNHVMTAVRTAVDRALETDSKVVGLMQAADRIGDVVRLISDIAGQTNLLALNATIEAARAGESGKGFAVVAGEVKALAAQTARATEQIGTQIVSIRSATSDAVQAVTDVSTAIGQVESVAAAIAAAVEQQAAATREISGNVQAVTTATASVAAMMEQMSSIAERTDLSSRSVESAAARVGATADTLTSEVHGFLKEMAEDPREAVSDYRLAA